ILPELFLRGEQRFEYDYPLRLGDGTFCNRHYAFERDVRERSEAEYAIGGDDSFKRQRGGLSYDGGVEFKQREIVTAERNARTELFNSGWAKFASGDAERAGGDEQYGCVAHGDSEWRAAHGGDDGDALNAGERGERGE